MGDNDEHSSAGRPSDVDEWNRLLSEQTSLFRKTVSRNEALETRLEEVERELSVWKVAMKTKDDERDELRKQVTKLERSIGSLKDDNPLILCLIDGDGNIFAPDLITEGRAGGRHAAMLLTRGLTEYMATIGEASAGRGQVWLTIYCNKKGLTETLTSNNMCTAEQFDEFVTGFNQAAPLFSFVDVGVGKEAADSKIKECMRVFARFPQTSRVFFGGTHDNGYSSTLNYLQNEGLHDKLTMLLGYKDLAYELKNLNLPHLEIEGVFMTKKLPTLNLYKKPANLPQAAPLPPPPPAFIPATVSNYQLYHDGEKSRAKKYTQADQSVPVQQSQVKRLLTPGLPLHKQKPPPCNFFYLNECKHGNKCRYAHDYALLAEHIEELRKNAKNWPCPYINNGQRCYHGEQCCMAHMCPKGPNCSFAKAKKCKFIGKGMHGAGADDAESSRPRSYAKRAPPSARSESPTTASAYTFGTASPLTSPARENTYVAHDPFIVWS